MSIFKSVRVNFWQISGSCSGIDSGSIQLFKDPAQDMMSKLILDLIVLLLFVLLSHIIQLTKAMHNTYGK